MHVFIDVHLRIFAFIGGALPVSCDIWSLDSSVSALGSDNADDAISGTIVVKVTPDLDLADVTM